MKKILVIIACTVYAGLAFADCTGTAWFINKDGYALTANHVIANMKKGVILIPPHKIPFKVIARDPKNDIAIIKADRPYPYTVPISPDKLTTGQMVGAFGYPNGELTKKPVHKHIQFKGTIVNINYGHGLPRIRSLFSGVGLTIPGMSGGPLLDKKGGAVGIVSGGDSLGQVALFVGKPTVVNYLNKHKIKFSYELTGKTPLQAIRMVYIYD